MNLPKVIQMKSIIKFGLAALGIGAILGATLPSEAETPDPSNPFTRHGLPVPGAYFKNKEGQKPATVAVSKSERGVGAKKQTTSTRKKKNSR
ncbi:MAG TPA: hypothetical protein VGI13_14365 [Candidatus Acidoferrum sp.]